jgi:hypothetical protein
MRLPFGGENPGAEILHKVTKEAKDESRRTGATQAWLVVGNGPFEQRRLAKMEETLSENQSGELRRESWEAKAEVIIREKLLCLAGAKRGFPSGARAIQPTGDGQPVTIGDNPLIKPIAEGLHLDSAKNARARLREMPEANQRSSLIHLS